ncbi:MAG: tail fiber protein [Geminicoccaceae bacterium]
MRRPPSDRTTEPWSRLGHAALGVLAAAWLVGPAPAHADTEPFLGQLAIFAGTYCPKGWLPADGRTLAINQNQALFSLLGTIYGGNGQTTFALPDLRGRASVGVGQGYGLSEVSLGQKDGTEVATVNISAGSGPERAQTQVGPFLGAQVPILPPELGITHCIASQGIFPSQN